MQEPPAGQGPIDPQGAFSPPSPPSGHFSVPHPPSGFAPSPPPPGMFPPGMMMPPPPPPPPQRGFARTIFVTLAGTLFSLSLMLNLYLLLSSGLFRSGSSTQSVIQEGDSAQRIAVVTVDGIITDSTADQVIEWLDLVESDANYKALVLQIDTPGGGLTASDRIYHRLAQLKERRNIPIAVTMGSLAASGGYYISCASDRIFAQPTTLTGSIGVVMMRYDASELAKKIGVGEKHVTAPAEGYKTAGSMFSPPDARETEYFQNLINTGYQRFIDVVKSGRGDRLTLDVTSVANGAIFTADDAVSKGLIDEIGYPEQAYAWAQGQAGLTKPRIIRFQRRPSVFDVLRSDASARASGATINLNLSIDPAVIEEFSTPRPMYLWRGQ